MTKNMSAAVECCVERVLPLSLFLSPTCANTRSLARPCAHTQTSPKHCTGAPDSARACLCSVPSASAAPLDDCAEDTWRTAVHCKRSQW